MFSPTLHESRSRRGNEPNRLQIPLVFQQTNHHPSSEGIVPPATTEQTGTDACTHTVPPAVVVSTMQPHRIENCDRCRKGAAETFEPFFRYKLVVCFSAWVRGCVRACERSCVSETREGPDSVKVRTEPSSHGIPPYTVPSHRFTIASTHSSPRHGLRPLVLVRNVPYLYGEQRPPSEAWATRSAIAGGRFIGVQHAAG